MTAESMTVRELGQPGDLGWVVQVHGELYAREYGWDGSFEALVATIVADFATDRDPKRAAAWIAELGGERAGCVFCVADHEDPAGTTAKLRILIVTPQARGHGTGATLVDRCLEFARNAGYRSINLWTKDVLGSARRIYQAAGFVLVGEQEHHSFGKDLAGQNWALEL